MWDEIIYEFVVGAAPTCIRGLTVHDVVAVVAQRFCIDTKGITYDGKVSVTQENIACQRWDSQHPHVHEYTDPAQFPDATLEDAANHCRAPDGRDIPWCYTTSAERRWDYCDFEDIYWGMKTRVFFVIMVGVSHRPLQNRDGSLRKCLLQRIMFWEEL